MANLVPVHIDKDTGRFVAKDIVGTGGGGPITGASGYLHTQASPSTIWTIVHGQDTKKIIHKIFDSNYNEVFPDNVQYIDTNTVVVTFGTAMNGFVHLMFFETV